MRTSLVTTEPAEKLTRENATDVLENTFNFSCGVFRFAPQSRREKTLLPSLRSEFPRMDYWKKYWIGLTQKAQKCNKPAHASRMAMEGFFSCCRRKIIKQSMLDAIKGLPCFRAIAARRIQTRMAQAM